MNHFARIPLDSDQPSRNFIMKFPVDTLDAGLSGSPFLLRDPRRETQVAGIPEHACHGNV